MLYKNLLHNSNHIDKCIICNKYKDVSKIRQHKHSYCVDCLSFLHCFGGSIECVICKYNPLLPIVGITNTKII